MAKKGIRNPFELVSKPDIDDGLADLRWKPYPASMKEAIDRIEHLYLQRRSQNKKWNSREIRPLLEQFVWSSIARHSQEPQVLSIAKAPKDFNPLRGLETADYLLSKITKAQDKKDQQNLFSTLFSSHLSGGEDVILYLLSLATQLAVSARNSKFLECCSDWMRDYGLDSFPVSYVANDLVKDLASIDVTEKYFCLPEYAPDFAADLVMAIAKIYRDKEKPVPLMNHLCRWIECYPSVCFIPPQSAIFELFRWSMFCISSEPRLHAALLSAIHRAGKGAPLQVIPHVMQIVQEFKHHRDSYCQKYGLTSLAQSYLRHKIKEDLQAYPNMDASDYTNHKMKRRTLKIQICRLFQIIQMLVSSGCLEENEVHPIFQAYEVALEFRFTFYVQLKRLYGIQEDLSATNTNPDPSPRSRKAVQTRSKQTPEKPTKGKRNSSDTGKLQNKAQTLNSKSSLKNGASKEIPNEVSDDSNFDSDDEDFHDRQKLLARLKLDCITRIDAPNESVRVDASEMMDTL